MTSPKGADHPISSFEDDLLGRKPFVESLAKALIEDCEEASENKRRATGYVIGLTGEWGAGKSSILSLLATHLGSLNNVLVVNFNPWLFSGRDELLAGFFGEIAVELGKTTGEQVSELLEALDKYRAAISTGLSTITNIILPGAGLAIDAANAAIPSPKPRSASESRKALEQKLIKRDVAIVVLIDELDRVEDDEVRAVAQLVKAIGDIRGISYLVAYDPIRVIDALGKGDGIERTRSGQAYIEKIVQLVIPIRPLLEYEVKDMLMAALSQRKYTQLECSADDQIAFIALLSQVLKTPRDVKRVVGNFAAIEPMVRGEVSPLDILGYCYLLAKAPTIRDKIARGIDEVVDDPHETVAIRRAVKKETPSIEGLFATATAEDSKILRFLFPIFGSKRTEDFDGDRICNRRNLLRLVYLGNPPHDVPRSDVDRVWQMDGASATQEIQRLVRDNKIRAFVERFIDLMPKLEPEHEDTFWTAMAKGLVRTHDWITSFEPQRSVVDDLETAIRKFGSTSERERVRAQTIVKALVKSGDCLIAPSLLRSHTYRYGLTGDPPRSYLPTVFTEAETNALIESEAPRYKAAILSGSQLKRLPDVDLIFLLLNMNMYDEALRESLTTQLDSAESFSTFSALMLPKGYLIDFKTVDQLIKVSRIEGSLNGAFGEAAFLTADPWVRQSTERMRSLLLN